MKKYHCKKTNTYIFNDDVIFKCDWDINEHSIDIKSNIDSNDINAKYIKGWDINKQHSIKLGVTKTDFGTELRKCLNINDEE